VLCLDHCGRWRDGHRPDQGVEKIGEPLVVFSITNLTVWVPTPDSPPRAAFRKSILRGGGCWHPCTFLEAAQLSRGQDHALIQALRTGSFQLDLLSIPSFA